jgi:hypothetical protein
LRRNIPYEGIELHPCEDSQLRPTHPPG